jgi:hypothetical protein
MRNGKADAAGENVVRAAGLKRRVNVAATDKLHGERDLLLYGTDRNHRIISPHLGLRKQQCLPSRSQAQRDSQ